MTVFVQLAAALAETRISTAKAKSYRRKYIEAHTQALEKNKTYHRLEMAATQDLMGQGVDNVPLLRFLGGTDE